MKKKKNFVSLLFNSLKKTPTRAARFSSPKLFLSLPGHSFRAVTTLERARGRLSIERI